MPGADRAGVDESVGPLTLGTERVEDRHRARDVLVAAADHQPVTFSRPQTPPDTPASMKAIPLSRQQLRVWSILGVARVTAVDHQVTRTEHLGQRRDGLVGHRARTAPSPTRPAALRARRRGRAAIATSVTSGPRVVSDDFVAALAQPLAHVEAHLAQADQTQLHVAPSFVAIRAGQPGRRTGINR